MAIFGIYCGILLPVMGLYDDDKLVYYYQYAPVQGQQQQYAIPMQWS